MGERGVREIDRQGDASCSRPPSSLIEHARERGEEGFARH